MRICLVNQYYYPDVAPTGRYAHDLARVLESRGHEVTVLCSSRSYNGKQSFPSNETIDGIKVRRLRSSGFGRHTNIGKMLDYLSFYLNLRLALRSLDSKPDIILAMTTPPYVGLATRLRGVRVIHWVMDVYPDVMVAHGMMDKSSFLYRWLIGQMKKLYNGSDLIFTLCPEMAERVAVYTTGKTVEWVPLWSRTFKMTRPSLASHRDSCLADEDIVLMYSGNMGLGHRFSEFMEAAGKMKDEKRLRWVFFGDGRRRKEIEQYVEMHPGSRIQLMPYVADSEVERHLLSADVHLISLDSEWQGLIMPSKLQDAMASGRPVILVGGEKSIMAKWIREADAGWCIAENDIDGLIKAVCDAMDPVVRKLKGDSARRFAQHNFSAATNIGRVVDLIEETHLETSHTMNQNNAKVPVTVLVPVKNEGANLRHCLAALKPASKIYVLDSKSIDDTAAIACDAGAEVVQFVYKGGYPKKRQWALDNLSIPSEWVLLVDADEIVTPELWQEIDRVINGSEPLTAYIATKQFHFLGSAFRFGGFSFGAVVLFKKGQACFEDILKDDSSGLDMEVHERLIVRGQVGRLKNQILHRDFKNLESYIARHNQYSIWEANLRYQYLKTGRYGSQTISARLFGNVQERRRFLKSIAVRMPFEPILWFLYHYILRLGFLEGSAGLTACMIRANYIAQVRAKVAELSRRS